MRIRSTNNNSVVTNTYRILSRNGKGVVTRDSTNTFVDIPEVTELKYVEDVVSEHFLTRRNRGELIMNPYRRVLSKRESIRVHLSDLSFQTYTSGVLTDTTLVSGVLGPQCLTSVDTWLPDPADVSNWARFLDSHSYGETGGDRDRTVARVVSKASESRAQALVTIAEMDKTVDLITSSAYRTSNMINTLKRAGRDEIRSLRRINTSGWRELSRKLRGKNLKKAGVSLASDWLMYRYGIMSTYYDIMSLISAAKSKRYRVRFTSGVSSQSMHTERSTYVRDVHKVGVKEVRLSRYSNTTAGLIVSLDQGLPFTDQFGATKGLSALWELVPWSFVIDWFLDVGTRLSALESIVLVPNSRTWVTTKSTLQTLTTVSESGVTTTSSPYVYYGRGSRGGSLLGSVELTERYADPTFSFLPSFNVRLNPKRLLDAVALWTQNRKKFSRLLGDC